MRDSILNILMEIRPEFDFSGSSDFIEDGFLDSFDVVNLVNSLDEHFHISIYGRDIVPENFSSISKIEELLFKYGVNQ